MTLTKTKGKAVAVPSKTTLNLAIREKNPLSPVKVIPSVAILLIAAFLFSKFAVADRLVKVSQAQGQLARLEAQEQALIDAVADYDAVAGLYARYSVGWMTDEEKTLLLRSEILDLIQEELMPNSRIGNFSISGNILSVQMSGITLNGTSQLVQRLYQLPSVTNVSVYTAATKEDTGDQVSVSMVITMTIPPEGGEAK